jgi:Sigma-70, region 4
MTAGYDEWAAARTPSLLAFASALAEDHRVADAAVAEALARMRVAWSRVAHDDPDLVARRHVVRACSTPRRAAVVLRVLEERPDAEIAEVLRCSESAVRRHLHRGLADVRRVTPEADPLSGVRERLAARAGSAPTQLLTRPPEASPATRAARRPRGPWLAALGVLLLVGGVAYVAHVSREPDGVISYPRVHVPETWRYESYAGVQLQVPDTWGWGASPVRSSIFAAPRHLGSCGSSQAAVLSPLDDAAYVSTLTRFVGRPAILTDRCMSWGSAGTMPVGEAVWFDSPLGVGVKPVGGTVAETRAVGSQHVTVFAPEPSLRRQILGTVEQVDVDANGCPAQAVALPTAGPRHLVPERLSVCVYSQDTGVATLMYSGAVPAAGARAFSARLDGALTRGNAPCPTPSGRWVALGLRGQGGTRWDVVNLGCDRIVTADGRAAELTPETVRDWASGGVTAYVAAPRGGNRVLAEYFRAPRG